MTNSALCFIESIVSNDIVNSGDYKNAEKLLEKEKVSSEKLADIFYLLGNKFFASNQKDAAKLSWKKSRDISIDNRKENSTQKFFLINRKKTYLKTIIGILMVFILLYVFLLVFFKRESVNLQLMPEKFFSKENSLWDEWWDTGRLSQERVNRRYGANELWPLIKRSLGNLFGEESQLLRRDVNEKLMRWLEFSSLSKFRKGPTDYYALTARGLFEAREFEEAISTLKDSIHFAETSHEFEKIYQDLGTVYYYRGYKLRLDGLANYNINDVRNSVLSYENALRYGGDPYLYGNLGWGYYLLDDFKASIENSLKALSLNSELNYVRMNLGIAYLKSDIYDLSFSAYLSLLNFDPGFDEYEGGIRDLMELQLESPGIYPFTHFIIGQLFWQQGFYKKSQSSLQKFLAQRFPQKIWKDKARLLLKKMEIE